RLRNFYRSVSDAATADHDVVKVLPLITHARDEFRKAMDDDLNTAAALAAVHNLVRDVNTIMAANRITPEERAELIGIIGEFNSVLGIFDVSGEASLDDEIEALVQEREDARAKRDFARSDELRDLLAEKGIVLEDTRDGVRWKRK